jgi:CubicO group peptidase (beta-lactamase class C family)
VAELGTRTPVDPTGSFRAGSVTKTFTATVVLQLIGERVLSLCDTIERWLPGMVPDGDGITLLHLLSHTSGSTTTPTICSSTYSTAEQTRQRHTPTDCHHQDHPDNHPNLHKTLPLKPPTDPAI